jgi:uncharacterized membrane protein YedE/YeeE
MHNLPGLPVRRAGNLDAMSISPGPSAPSGPQHAPQKKRPNPLVVAGAAFGIGTLLAKIIDWRGHAHPRC